MKKRKSILKKIKSVGKKVLPESVITRIQRPSYKVKNAEPGTEAPLVIVLSRSYSYSTALSVIRSLGEAGYTVDFVAVDGLENIVPARSKYVRNYIKVSTRGKISQGLLDALQAYVGKTAKKPVLFPADDYTVSVLDRSRSLLEENFVLPGVAGGADGSLTEHMDKSLQSTLARAVGLSAPQEWILPLERIPELPEDLVFPCFCKPLQSISGNKTEMAVCQDEDELLAHLRALRKRRRTRSVLIQEYLEIDREYVLSGVCLDQDVIIPGVIHKTMISRKTTGVTLSGRVQPFESLGDVCADIIRMLRSYHYSGMFDLELYRVGDRIYFGELNLRSGGPNFACFRNGVNLPALYVKGVMGQLREPEESRLKTSDRSFINERVAYDDWLNGYLTRDQLRYKINEADDTIVRFDEDPKPWETFSGKLMPYLHTRKLVKRGLRKAETVLFDPVTQTARNTKHVIYGYPIAKRGIPENLITEEPSVVVLSRSYSTGLSVIRALGTAGYTVDLVASSHHIGRGIQVAASSRFVRYYTEVVSKKVKSGRDGRLLRQLLRYSPDNPHKPVLFPTDDYTASVMDQNRTLLSDRFVMPGVVDGGDGSMTACMDKTFQSSLARKAGLAVPREWMISLEEKPVVIPEDIVFPCFVKPIESISGYKTEMARCDSLPELEDHLRLLRRHYRHRSVLVQEYLKIDSEIVLAAVCLDQEIIIPAVIRKTGIAKYERGVTLSGALEPFENLGELCEPILRMLRGFRFRGMIDMELNVVGDRVYFNEVNLRSGGPNFSYFLGGANLPALFVRSALGQVSKPEEAVVDVFGKSFVSEKVVWDDYLHGCISREDRDRHLESAQLTLLRYDPDPRPWEIFRRSMRFAQYRQFRSWVKSRPLKRAISRTKRDIRHTGYGYPVTKRGIPGNLITEEPSVVVLSRSYSTGLSVIRSLGKAGFTVDLVASSHHIGRGIQVAASSRFVRYYTEVVSKKVKSGRDRKLLKHLMRYSPDSPVKPVLFPTDDYTASVIDQNRTRLSSRFVMPGVVDGGDGSMTACMDKTFQSSMAREAGLAVPREWMISLEELPIVIPEDMVYPCFVKPIESISGYKTEMARCDSLPELEKHLSLLRKHYRHRSVLVQEYLEIDTEIDLSGVCLDQEIIIPAVIRKTGIAKYERGVTLSGALEPFENLGDLCEPILRMLRGFRFRGMIDMELNVVGDRVYFNEVNLRSGGPNFSYFLGGANLPALFVRDALGQPRMPEEAVVDVYGKSFVSEKVAWDDYLHGCISREERDRHLESAELTLLRYDSDPDPWEVFLRSMRFAQYRKARSWVKSRPRECYRWIRRTVFPPLRNFKYVLFSYPQTKKKNRRDPNAEKPRVLITGRNYCSNLCMARSFGEAGYEVEVLRIFQSKQRWKQYLTPEAYSKFVKAYYVCVTRHQSERLVTKLRFLADPDRKMLLIPNDDLAAEIVDTNFDELSRYYLIPNVAGTQGEISRLMSKEVQKQLAIEAGLPVVNGCVIAAERGEFEIPETVSYPCFIKPNISKNSAKNKMKRCNSEEELRATLSSYSRKKRVEMLVEDYLDIKAEYSLLGLSTKDRVLGPGYFVAEYGGHVERRGVAMTGKILPPSVHQELVDQLIRFIESLHYDGLYDVDLIETTDGKLYFAELNFRYGASGYAVTESGLNLPGMFADYMCLGKPIDPDCCVPETGKRFISEKVMIDEYKAGYLKSLSELRSFMDSVDVHFIKNAEDPGPYRNFSLLYPIYTLKRSPLPTA